jgi:hypothetical protein
MVNVPIHHHDQRERRHLPITELIRLHRKAVPQLKCIVAIASGKPKDNAKSFS